MVQKKGREKSMDICGLGGCFSQKIGAGLFCARHWGMVDAPTQAEYCKLYLAGPGSAEDWQAQINGLELLALGQIARYLQQRAQKKGEK